MDPPPPSFPPTASSPQPVPRKSPLVPPPIHHLNGGNQGSPHHLGLSKAAKRRVRVACIQCKLSKVRCDDTRPCRRCVKRHMADMCVDAHQKPRGRKRSEDGMFISTSPSSTHKHAFLSPSSHGSHPYSPRPGSGRNSPAPSPSSAPLRRASPHSHNRNTSFGSMNTYQQKFVYSPSPLVQSLSLASAERSSSVPIVSNNSSLRIHLSPPTQGGADNHSPASLARQALEFQQQQQAALENSQQQMFSKFSFPDMSKGPQFNQNYNVGFPSLLTATSSYAGAQGHSDPSMVPNDIKPLYGDAKMVSSPPAHAGPNLLLGSNTFDPVLAAQLAALGQQNMRSGFDGSIKMEGQQISSPPLQQQFNGPPALNMNLITQHNQSYMLPQPHSVGFMGSPQQSLPSFLQLAQGGGGPANPNMAPDTASLWSAMQQQMAGQDPNGPSNGSPHNNHHVADITAWSYLRGGPGFDGVDGPAPMAQTPLNAGPTPTHGPGGGGMTRSGSSEMIADMNQSLDALFSAAPSSSAAQSSDLAMQMMGMGPPYDISAFRPSPQSSPSHADHALPSPSSAPVPMLNPAHYLGSSLRMRSEFLHPRSPASESHASDHDSVRTHTPLPPGATRAASYSHSVSDSGYANDPILASLPSLSAHALRLHDPSTPRPESSSPVGMMPQQPHSGSSSSPVTSPHLRNFDVASPSKSPFHNPPSNMRAHSCSSLPAGAGDSASNAMLNFPSSPESFITDSTPHSFSIQLELPGAALDQASSSSGSDRPTIRPLFRDAHSIST